MLNYENYGYADYQTGWQNQNFYQDYARIYKPVDAVAAPEISPDKLELHPPPLTNPPPSSQSPSTGS